MTTDLNYVCPINDITSTLFACHLFRNTSFVVTIILSHPDAVHINAAFLPYILVISLYTIYESITDVNAIR